MAPMICGVIPSEKHTLKVEFTNGERRVFDASPYLSRGVFVRLQDPYLFSAVKVVEGCLEWPGGLDLSNDTVYLRSVAPHPAASAH